MIETELTIKWAEKMVNQLQLAGLDQDDLGRLARLAVAVELYRRRHLSMGQAAEVAGMERAEFAACLAERGAAFIDLDDEELEREFGVVDAMMKGKEKS